MVEVNISDVKVMDRIREDMGDVAGLAGSIKEVGQLQPIGLAKDNTLIFGQRRLEACKLLGRDKVFSIYLESLDDAHKMAKAEHAENSFRKPLRPSEAVKQGKLLEDFARKAAAERKRQGQRKGGGDRKSEKAKEKSLVGPSPTSDSDGESRDKPKRSKANQARDQIGESVGMSGRSYQRAKTVVTAAEEDPEAFGPIVEEMDKSGKIIPAFEKVRELQEEKKRQEKAQTNGVAKPTGDASDDQKKKRGSKEPVGIFRAHDAIDCLKRIPTDDLHFKRAAEIVVDWIKNNMEKRCQRLSGPRRTTKSSSEAKTTES